MYKNNSNIRRIAMGLIVLALLFNSVGSLFAASSLLTQAQTFANQDATLICTGKTFKWISLRAFEETGKVVFIEAPDGAPDSPQHLKCAFTYLAESNSDDEFVGFDTPKFAANTSEISPQFFEFFVSSRKYQFASTRAPPYIS